MPTNNSTATTGNLMTLLLGRYTADELARLLPTLPSMAPTTNVRIDPYTPVLAVPNAWLSAVEERIRASTRPPELQGEESAEWLSVSAASTAINFLRQAADLLPTEPHIYASDNGDLVAEFETEASNVTSVVTPEETILFGVSSAAPAIPVKVKIRRGSNRLREEVKTFVQELGLVSNGKTMATSR
jgi:hypothetical protein